MMCEPSLLTNQLGYYGGPSLGRLHERSPFFHRPYNFAKADTFCKPKKPLVEVHLFCKAFFLKDDYSKEGPLFAFHQIALDPIPMK